MRARKATGIRWAPRVAEAQPPPPDPIWTPPLHQQAQLQAGEPEDAKPKGSEAEAKAGAGVEDMNDIDED